MAVMEAIQTIYCKDDAASVEFASIPSTYQHLQLRMSIKDGADTDKTYLYFRFNSDTTEANYARRWMQASDTSMPNGSASGAQTRLGAVVASMTPNQTQRVAGANYSGVIADIFDYANTNKNTTVQYVTSTTYVTTSFSHSLICGAILWDNTAAVTSITLSDASGLNGGIRRNSELTLYGIKSS